MTETRHEIRDVDGAVLHAGTAPGRRRFVEDLVRKGASFRRADLRDWPLNHLHMDGLRFDGADLTGADLTGSSVCGANFTDAVMRGVSADGLRARNARLKGADMSPADGTGGPKATSLAGADLTAADLQRVVLDGADATGATLVAARLFGAHARGTVLRDARLGNAEFGDATLVRCDLTGADLTSSSGADAGDVHDRTENTLCVDNVWTDAKLDAGVPAFGRDRVAGRAMKGVSVVVSGTGVATAAALLPHDVGHLLHGAVGGGVALVVTVGLFGMVKMMAEEKAKERLGEGFRDLLSACKGYLSDAMRRGVEATRLVAAAVNRPAHRAVMRALADSAADAGSAGHHAVFRDALAGQARFVLCDRSHLALALSRMHLRRMHEVRPRKDLVLVRQDPTGDAPTAMRFHADGAVTAVWRPTRTGRSRNASWAGDGSPADHEGFHEGPPRLDSTEAAFEDVLWRDHGMARPYLARNHRLAAGQDGSVHVLHEKTGKLDNAFGPAVIGVDGSSARYRQGVRQTEPMDDEELSVPAFSPA